MTFERVLRSEDLPHATGGGGRRLRDEGLAGTIAAPIFREARLSGRDVLLTRLHGGEVVAFAAFCPHQGISLAGASIFDGNVRCPQHGYLYDPRTGSNVLPTRRERPEVLWRLKPRYLPTYPVEERDGWIWVDEQPNPPPLEYDPTLEEPPAGDRQARRAAAGTPPAAVQPTTDQPTEHPAEAVTAVAGSELALALPTDVEPGHLWHVEVSDERLTLLGTRFEGGEAASCTVRLAAHEPGSATIRCAYAKPWSTRPREVRTFVVRVDPPG